MTRRFLCLALLAATGVFAQPSDLDVWTERALKAFDVPGAAIGIVKDGKVVHLRGYGVRRLGDGGKVDEHTLFGIASNTKAFTAAALGLLVDDGKLSWDDPVQKHLPSFQVQDPYISRELTVRDLLSHRSGLGLGAGDLLFWPDTTVTRDQVVFAARFLPVASGLRSRYNYNNLAFVVAGEVVRAACGVSWDDFVRQRIFKPLGMTETRISGNAADNTAVPHSRGWRLQGTLTAIPPTKDETWAAAAGIRANVHDLTKWMLAQLGEAKRPWSDGVAKEMHAAQTVMRITDPSPSLKATKPNFAAYGLGWSLRDYKGRKIVTHGGALTGMVSLTLMVPEERLGIVVLTNQEESGAMSAIAYHVLDHYFKLESTDWIAAYRESRKSMLERANAAEAKLDAERAKDSRPSLKLSQYADEYTDPWFGAAAIHHEKGTLVLRFPRTPAMVADLQHWQHDSFRAKWRDKTIPDAFVWFALDARGRVETMRMEAVSSLADFSFDYQDLLFRPVRR